MSSDNVPQEFKSNQSKAGTLESFVELQHKQLDTEQQRFVLESRKLDALSDLEKTRMNTIADQNNKERTLKYFIYAGIFALLLIVLVGAYVKESFLVLVYDVVKFGFGGLVGSAITAMKIKNTRQ